MIMATQGKKESKSNTLPQRVSSDVYLICGRDEYRVSETAASLVARLCPPEQQAFGLEIVDGRLDAPADLAAAIYRTIEAVRTPAFFGRGKVVWLKGFSAFEVRESSELNDALAVLSDFIKGHIPAGQTLVITARKVDGRSAFFRACQSAGVVEVFDVPDKSYKEREFALDTAEEAFRRAGLHIVPEALEEFCGRVGSNTWQIVQEVEKLVVYLGTRREVSLDDVQTVTSVTREAAVWDLSDAIGERNLRKALDALDDLLFRGENEIGIITVVENRLRDLATYRWCLDKGWVALHGEGRWLAATWASNPAVDQALSALPKDPRAGHPFFVAKTIAQAARFTSEELDKAQRLVLQTHQRLFNSALPTHAILEFMLIKLLGAAEMSTPLAGSGDL